MYELATSTAKSKQECILLVDDDTSLLDTLNEGAFLERLSV